MICFLDTTFCSSPNCRGECGRQLTPELVERGKKWWGGDDFPVAMAQFCDDEGKLLVVQGAS